MSITLHIPPELEERLSAEAQRLQRPLEVVALDAIEGALGIQQDENRLSAHQWERDLWDWIGSHKPVSHFIDDSRESIYGDER